jgi:hypothetical protein
MHGNGGDAQTRATHRRRLSAACREGGAHARPEQDIGGPPPGMGKVGCVGGIMTCELHLL